ncbi:hypothetical protein N7499_000862 [Penicillium canescens]|uniref:Uncharacterized protein n=1 Tax=Penicillium canescens TaxID=5083 RepID=A0AAD6IHM9_PENCN|nr:hypothetical protein N7460_004294 [Penicillium canescens]KAJ6101232.1 hypothetical protein N7499_000862 [Penicillium canescens]
MDTQYEYFVPALRSQVNNLRHYPGRHHNPEQHDFPDSGRYLDHHPRIIEQLEMTRREMSGIMATIDLFETVDSTELRNLCSFIMPVLPLLISTLRCTATEDHKVAFDLARILTHADIVNRGNFYF